MDKSKLDRANCLNSCIERLTLEIEQAHMVAQTISKGNVLLSLASLSETAFLRIRDLAIEDLQSQLTKVQQQFKEL